MTTDIIPGTPYAILLKSCHLPVGWQMVLHHTRNAIVHDGERGFVVTELCMKEWPLNRIVKEIETVCSDIDAKGSSSLAQVYTLDEIAKQAKGPTTFDPLSIALSLGKETAHETH